ncbi:UvrD-helicase domain-containing protein [Marinobacter sp. AC-23]|uniref:UvrD-helicase domain-containing protein n=1 Tax=Marinobacter sp. AC-23 TaxID=1879031 RepID=UPI0008DD358B|nr:UvrD-helicase domain-containing protein [Marinobacter sp. AC-23]OHY82024.1 hypothetical protein BCA33_09105 [Marinobacter sp. AC-23]
MFDLPTITDEDIAWACRVMKLPKSAFYGDGNDERASILKSNETLDIEACPGSGKTTLLVAKLAILARHWKDRQRGICVLSHTNVARAEIEERLKTSEEGEKLLRYPHFIGTIHGFVNEYLALPYMRSQGIPIEVIDSEFAQERRWRDLPHGIRSALEKNHLSKTNLKYVNTSCEPGRLSWGKGGTLGSHTSTYKAIHEVCVNSCLKGIHCYEEPFVWAEECLEQVDNISEDLRYRFPMLFMDEVQDTTEQQSKVLNNVFMEGTDPVIRQRFGDVNQGIFGSTTDNTATTDPFPDELIRCDIQNSFRFHQGIADLAGPFGVLPQNLIGVANTDNTHQPPTCKNVVFLFDSDSIDQVIPAFGEHLRRELSDEEVSTGKFVAVGGVHKLSNDEKKYTVCHYWPAYSPTNANHNALSRNFVTHLSSGKDKSAQESHSHPAIQAFGAAILRGVALTDPSKRSSATRSAHRDVIRLLSPFEQAELDYKELAHEVCLETDELTEDRWNLDYRPRIERIICEVCETMRLGKATQNYLDWPQAKPVTDQISSSNAKHNTIYFQDNGLKIKVGSIHSVKGETHTATLVLDTFYHGSHFKALKPWLLGKKNGGSNIKPRDTQRLKLHYVAMTRPSKILCIAIRMDEFKSKEVDLLKSQGWCVARVRKRGTELL